MNNRVFNFIICDNQKKYLEIIEKIVNDFFINKDIEIHIHLFDDYTTSFRNLTEQNLENKVYLLDIKTRISSGIDVARDIRKIDNKSPIIFITSHEDYALEILKSLYNINGFISKRDNHLKEDLNNKLENLISYADKNLYLSFVENNTSYHILMSSIIYIEIVDRKTLIHIVGEEPLEVNLSLEKTQELLDMRFERIHKSCIANMSRAKIISKRKRFVVFDNGETTDLISRDYKIKEKEKKSILNIKKVI